LRTAGKTVLSGQKGKKIVLKNLQRGKVKSRRRKKRKQRGGIGEPQPRNQRREGKRIHLPLVNWEKKKKRGGV